MRIKKCFVVIILMVILIIEVSTSRTLALSDEQQRVIQTSLQALNNETSRKQNSIGIIRSIPLKTKDDRVQVAGLLVEEVGKNIKLAQIKLFLSLVHDLKIDQEFQDQLLRAIDQKSDLVGVPERLTMVQRLIKNSTVTMDQGLFHLLQAIQADQPDVIANLASRGLKLSTPIRKSVIQYIPWNQEDRIVPLDLAATLGSFQSFCYLNKVAQQQITATTLISACIGGNFEIVRRCYYNLSTADWSVEVLSRCIQLAIAFNHEPDFPIARWLNDQLLLHNGGDLSPIVALWSRDQQAEQFLIRDCCSRLPDNGVMLLQRCGIDLSHQIDPKDFDWIIAHRDSIRKILQNLPNYNQCRYFLQFLEMEHLITFLKGSGIDLINNPHAIMKMIEQKNQIKFYFLNKPQFDRLFQYLLETTRLGRVTVDEATKSTGVAIFPDNDFFVVPAGVTIVSKKTFWKKTPNLNVIALPMSVIAIDAYAFANCSRLSSIDLPDQLKGIGTGAFLDCTSLNRVKIPRRLLYINDVAFYNCRKLSSINLPASLMCLGYFSFGDCSRLSSDILPNIFDRSIIHDRHIFGHLSSNSPMLSEFAPIPPRARSLG